METRVDRLQELLVGRCLALEDRAASDVHVRNVTFKVQERAVEPRQPVAVGHLWILALAASCGLGGPGENCEQYHTYVVKVCIMCAWPQKIEIIPSANRPRTRTTRSWSSWPSTRMT